MKEINKIQLNTEEYIIEPPIANETIQGGILAKQKTNESVPVKIRDGKCFIPEYPNGDSKIDIAQSAQNKDKVMVVNNSGELEATEYKASNDNTLFGHVDKQETHTINDGFNSSLKNLIVNGKTIQKVETDIVPTPQRPIPINSRKTLVTKANSNVFDLAKESDVSNIPDAGTYRSIGQHQLKANTKYIFEWSEATVPAKSTLSFQIQDDKGTVLASPFTYFNLEATEKKETGKQVEFTTTSSGIIKFAYNCTVGASSTTEMYQQYWYTKILKDIVLKEDVEYATEYVELRSLKESKNLFDKNIMAFTSGTLNSDGTVGTNASYAVSGFVPVKPSTQYTIKVIDGFRGSTKVYYDTNKQVILNEAITTFTTPSNCYFVRWQTVTTDTRVLTEEDIQKINDEMMMVKGDSLPSSYVPPTVRDYKIVDHTAKTAKIVRNVKYVRVTPELINNQFNDYNESMKRAIIRTSDRFVIANVTKAGNELSNMAITRFGLVQNGNVFSDILGIAYMYWYPDISMLGLNGSEAKDDADQKLVEFLTNNEMYVQYQLATPVEETITYVETDVSEVGYSWQDTTSPSPTIKSEVKPVEKIDILKTGKNLFDVEKAKNIGSWDGGTAYKHFTGICFEPNTTYTFSVSKNNMFLDYKNEYNNKIAFYIGETIDSASPNVVIGNSGLNNSNAKTLYTFTTTEKPMYLNLYVNRWDVRLFNIVFEELLQNIQIEVGDTATAYEPYAEQRVNITLPQSMYENDVANVESGEYEYYTKNTTIDFNRFDGNLDLIQDNTVRYYFHKSFAQELDGIILDTLLFDCFRKVDDNSDTIHFKIGGVNNEYIFMFIPRGPIDNKAYAKEYLNSLNLIANFTVATKTTQPIPPEDLAKLKSLKVFTGVTNNFSNVPLTFDYEKSVQIIIDNIKKQIDSANANILIGG